MRLRTSTRWVFRAQRDGVCLSGANVQVWCKGGWRGGARPRARSWIRRTAVIADSPYDPYVEVGVTVRQGSPGVQLPASAVSDGVTGFCGACAREVETREPMPVSYGLRPASAKYS
eukprot:2694533-Prymnesium_polylepis.2